jgi:hypothetical protein
MTTPYNQDDQPSSVKNSPASQASSDEVLLRLADPWTDKIKRYTERIQGDAERKMLEHSRAGHYYRSREVRWVIPSMLVPVCFSPLVLISKYAYGDTCEMVTASDYVAAGGLLLSSFLTVVCGFFKYGERSALHHTYAAKYSDVVTDIAAEVIKKKQFRVNADLFVATMRIKYDNLVFGEPVVPLHLEGEKNKNITIGH